jgi:hypothetical protein
MDIRMADFIKSAGFNYNDLEMQAAKGNEIEYAIDELRDLVSAAYPDNSRDARIEDIESQVRYARKAMAAYLTEVERLIVIAKGRGNDYV